MRGGCLSRPTPLPPNFNVGEQEIFFKKIWAEMFECDNNIEIQGRGEGRGRPSDVKYWRGLVGATPQFWKICAQKGISVQHLGSGIYAFSTYPHKPKTKVGEKVFGWVGNNTLYLFRHCWHLKRFIDVLYFITSYSLYTLYTRAAIRVDCE